MNRIFSYLLLSGLLGVGIFAGYTVFKVEDKPIEYKFVTRAGVDSTQFEKYIQQQTEQHPINKPFPWAEMTTLIISVTVAYSGIHFKSFKRDVFERFATIEAGMQSVIDNRNRKTIDERLLKIERDAISFVDDENVKAYLEGMGGRTRSFCNDVMTMDFTPECLENAKMKMSARNQDGRHHAKDLGFSDYFQGQLNEIRIRYTKKLDLDLDRLCKDHLHNSKYERFGDIACRFYEGFAKAVVKLYYETKPEQ